MTAPAIAQTFQRQMRAFPEFPQTNEQSTAKFIVAEAGPVPDVTKVNGSISGLGTLVMGGVE